jgi:pyruvate formate lyase activating enzyme
VKALILNLQRMSTEDGPGIRTTAFFKGCPLACDWCHNPESLDPRPRANFQARACLGCRACAGVCPNGALPPPEVRPRPDLARCEGCGACARACPAAALQVQGVEWTAEALVTELARDRVFFEESGGGVTASGGEPLLWPAFVTELFERLAAVGISRALDTSGHASPGALVRAASRSDLVLLDLKLFDPEAHRRHTGQDNRLILENARRLAASLPAGRLWIRTPLIPGVTAREDNLRALGGFIAGLGPAFGRWELLAFNNLCREQYLALGRSWPYATERLLAPDELAHWTEVARGALPDPGRVVATGPTRVE